MSLKSRIIEINGIKLNVVIEGEGRPVILLHGFPDSSVVWRSQIDFLAKNGFMVIAPDLRGFGESDAPKGRKNYKVDAIAGDVVKIMDVLGIQSASIVGHDWGAVAGWALAMNHHERVDRYVAVSVGHPRAYRSDFMQKFHSWYVVLFQIPFISEWLVRAFRWKLLRALTKNHTEIGKWTADMSREGRLTAGLNWYRKNFLHILFHDFARVKVPVLGIWSSGDIFLTEGQMKKSADYVDGPWRYERIDGSGHWVPLDASDKLNRMLIEYVGNDNRGGGPI
jgi:pimeloyl-ACP methyl ester carboxylesterase